MLNYLKRNTMLKLYNLGCSFARGNLADSYNHLSDQNIGPGTLLAKFLNREEINLARMEIALMEFSRIYIQIILKKIV